jgi:hypothetical protein
MIVEYQVRTDKPNMIRCNGLVVVIYSFGARAEIRQVRESPIYVLQSILQSMFSSPAKQTRGICAHVFTP